MYQGKVFHIRHEMLEFTCFDLCNNATVCSFCDKSHRKFIFLMTNSSSFTTHHIFMPYSEVGLYSWIVTLIALHCIRIAEKTEECVLKNNDLSTFDKNAHEFINCQNCGYKCNTHSANVCGPLESVVDT